MPLRLLVVDDEALYVNAITQHLAEPAEFASKLEIAIARTAADALAQATGALAPQMIILDVDLGRASQNGFDVLRVMRSKNVASFVCIHTNRVMTSDNQAALQAGADAFLPKPMTRAHLLKLIIQAMQKEMPTISSDKNVGINATKSFASIQIAIVDDDPLVHMGWEMNLAGAVVACFDSPEKFFAHADNQDEFLNSLTCVVTDFHFDTSSNMNGIEFATKLRFQKDIPVLLSTNATLQPEEYLHSIHAVIPKQPPESVECFREFLSAKPKSSH